MFLGDYQHTLDAKGRVSLPSKFRSDLKGKIVVSKGLDQCLFVFPAEEYERFVESLVTGGDFDPRKRELRRFFIAGAVSVELDSAGRIQLPQVLREYAGLGRDVEVTGNGNRIEIWDSASWNTYSTEAESRVEDLARELADAGLL